MVLSKVQNNLLDSLFALSGAVPGTPENIYETLTSPLITSKGEDAPVTLAFE